MDSHEVLLAATYLLGTLAAFCLGQSGRDGPGKKEHEKGRGFVGAQVMLSGSNSKCQGLVEVQMNGMKTVCSSSWRLSQDLWKNANEASTVCQQLGCGNPLALGHLTLWNRPKNQILCQGPPWSFSNCSTSSLGQCLPLSLVCLGR